MAGRIIYDGGIVTNGLIMYLDAGKSDSYPREGTTWRDISGSNNGTLVNGPAFTPANGGSIAFDGVNDYATLPINVSSFVGGLSSITLNVWSRKNLGSGVRRTVMDIPMTTEVTKIFLEYQTDNTIRFGGRSQPSDAFQSKITTLSYPNDNWVLITGIINLAANDIKIYVNGVEQTTTGTPNFSQTTFSSSTGNNPTIAAISSNQSLVFNGNIAAVQLYNRALSETEILQNYNATKDRYLPNQGNIVKTDLVLSLEARIIESYIGSGTTWRDLTANQSTASLINGPTFSRERGSITFDGVNDYARINSFGRDNVDPLSVFCWVNPSNLTNWSFGGVFLNWIINKRPGGAGSDSEWQFVLANSKMTVGVWDSAGNAISIHPYQDGVYTLQLNQWQYVGFVTSGVNGGVLNTYYNGELNLEGSLSGTRAKRVSNMDIGKTGWDNILYWTGGISSVSIYNRVLSLSEIQQNFNATKAQYGL
jgi:hypothetical protein